MAYLLLYSLAAAPPMGNRTQRNPIDSERPVITDRLVMAAKQSATGLAGAVVARATKLLDWRTHSRVVKQGERHEGRLSTWHSSSKVDFSGTYDPTTAAIDVESSQCQFASMHKEGG